MHISAVRAYLAGMSEKRGATAARAASIPEVTGGAAWLFDPLSPEAIADAIYTVLNDRDLRTNLAAQCYERVQSLGWNTIAPRLARIHEAFGR